MAELERAQQKAAELILDDESWRDGLEDEAASALLDATLAQIDAALARASEDGTLNEDLPYVLADQARAALRDRAASQTGSSEAGTEAEASGADQALIPEPISDAPGAPPDFLPPDESLSDEPEVSPQEATDPPP